MAIKTSWTAGEVLTAADLTDTFADKVDLTPSATQTISSGTATVKPLVIKAAASQTANLLEFQNSAGTAVRAVLPDGTITGQNLLYNGAMQVAQRGTSTASITTTGFYTADRYSTYMLTAGTWTQSIENDAPTGSGLRKSLKMLCTTANASLSAGSIMVIRQKLEGQDVQRVAKGTASGQQLTLSFWIKSNVTGAYVASLYDYTNTRIVSASYSVSASAAWEKKTITFPADTTGAIANDNAAGLQVTFWLAAGTTFTSSALATVWASDTEANNAAGQTNLAAAINNYWQVTGVQLEVGPVASAFEFKPYGQELSECQRYYYRNTTGANAFADVTGFGAAASTTSAQVPVIHPVVMRTAPTAVTYSALKWRDAAANSVAITAATLYSVTPHVTIVAATSSSLTQHRPITLCGDNSTTAHISLEAEL